MRRLMIGFLAGVLAMPIGAWVWWQERRILREGRVLDAREATLAAAVGVADVAGLRVLVVERVPMPGPQWLHGLAQRLGFPAMTAAGMSLGRGIYWQRKFENRLVILVHECVHAAQYARFGMWGFLRRYLAECLADGYVNAPLEREAVERSEAACRC